MGQFSGAGNGYDIRSLLQQPSQGNLGGSHAARPPKLLQNIDNTHIGSHGLRRETRQGLAVVVVRVKLRVFIDAAPQESPVERAVRDKAYTQFTADIQNAIVFNIPVHEMVFTLNGCQGMDGVGLANCTGSDFAHAPAPHLAFLDQFGDGSRYIFNGHPGIKAVLVE